MDDCVYSIQTHQRLGEYCLSMFRLTSMIYNHPKLVAWVEGSQIIHNWKGSCN